MKIAMNWFKRFWKSLNEPVQQSNPSAVGVAGNLTPRAQQALALSRKEAERLNHNFVGTEHLLLGLIALGQGVAVNILRNRGLDLETVRREIGLQIGTGLDQRMIGTIPYTPRVKKVLALANLERRSLNHTYLGTEHILLGILREGDGVAGRVLSNLGLNIEQTRQEILKELDPNFESSQGQPEPVASDQVGPASPEQQQDQATPSLRPQCEPLDTRKRYDVYCSERNQDIVVYRNATFKGVRKLFQEVWRTTHAEFFELEQANGQTIFVACYSVIKFCEPGVRPDDSPCE